MSGRIEKNAVQSAIINTIKALAEAQKFATETRDIESLVVISDRWMNTAYKIKGLDKNTTQMIGFIQEDYGDEDESGHSELHSEPK